MSLNASLSNYIGQQANSLLAPYGLASKGGSMGVGYSASASSSATASGRSGDISGGTAFNIGGINLGQQYQSPTSAEGGNPAQSISGALGLPASSLGTIAIVGALALAAIVVVRLIRK